MSETAVAAGALGRLFGVPAVRRASRTLSDWVDLQFSFIIAQLEAVAPRTRGRLLDVGCGDKPYEGIFAPFVEQYVTVEYEDTFSKTQSSARASRPDYFYDGKRLPFDSGSFDVVMNIQVLEHTPHPQTVLNEIGRVVRRDGLVIVCAPFSFRLHEEPHDYFRFTPHGLRSMFDEAGLAVDELWSQGDLWSVLGHKFNSYLGMRVARIAGIAQAMGKMGHEDARAAPPRYWTLPLVLPTMCAVSAASRLLDRVAPDGTETLSYMALGRPRA